MLRNLPLPKKILTDNGSEFVNREVTALIVQSGSEHYRTCPLSPHQNGVCERHNAVLKTILRKVLMAHEDDLARGRLDRAQVVDMVVAAKNQTKEAREAQVQLQAEAVNLVEQAAQSNRPEDTNGVIAKAVWSTPV